MIKETYNDLMFLELINNKFISVGIAPSEHQLLSVKNQVELLNLGLDSKVKFMPVLNGSSSNIQHTINTANIEFKSIRASSLTLKTRGQNITDRANNDISLIARDTMEILLNICTFELARQNNMYLNNWDSFVDMLKIDQQKTSAHIDISSRSATLKKQPAYHKYDLTYLKPEDFEVFVLSGQYIGLNLAVGSAFTNLTDDMEGYWAHQLVSLSPGPKTLVLQVDLQKPINISGLAMKLISGDSEEGVGVRVLASPDGTTWQEMAPKRFYTSSRADIQLVPVFAQYLRLELTKTKPSFQINETDINYVYEFIADGLDVFETRYYVEGQLVSKPLVFREAFNIGTPQIINRLRFDVSEEKPAGTDIIYYISTTNSVDSIRRIEPGVEIILDTVLGKKTDQIKVQSRFDASHALINHQLESGFISESIRFFRNTFQRNVFINGVQAGWELENSYYKCIFEIEEELELDLGINFAFIDGARRNGIVVIEPGFHTFKTHEINWKVAASEDNDPLFPHNHKLLIEGLIGSDAYKGAAFIASKELTLISPFDLVKIIPLSNNNFFAIRNGMPMIKIPKPLPIASTIEGWRLEQHGIRYKYETNALNQTNSITFVARLKTNNTKYTPVLRGYTAIAGF